MTLAGQAGSAAVLAPGALELPTAIRASGQSDRQLLALMVSGDRAAAGSLFDSYGDMLYGLAHCMVRDPVDAEEAVTQAFSDAWQTAAFFSARDGKVVDWLLAHVRRCALVTIRGRAR